MTYTAGPWKIVSEKANCVPGSPIESEIRGYNTVIVRLGRMITDQQKADARLIAMAPEIYEALLETWGFISGACTDIDGANAIIGKIGDIMVRVEED